MSTLANSFVNEQARVRNLLRAYREIGPAGSFGAVAIEGVLQRAEKAAIGHDLVAILRSYEELKGCE